MRSNMKSGREPPLPRISRAPCAPGDAHGAGERVREVAVGGLARGRGVDRQDAAEARFIEQAGEQQAQVVGGEEQVVAGAEVGELGVVGREHAEAGEQADERAGVVELGGSSTRMARGGAAGAAGRRRRRRRSGGCTRWRRRRRRG
jgi:hypothetical protein